MAVADSAATMQNIPVTGNAASNDIGAGSSLNPVFTPGSMSSSTGTFSMNPSTGQYTFTPATGFTGTTSITYTLCNLSSPPCSTTTITFTVFPNLIANNDPIVTSPSVSVTGSLLTNDNGIVPGATYTVSVTQPSPTTGTITINPTTGQYTFVPNPAFTGTAATTYTVCNTSVNPIACSSATITIIIGVPIIGAAKELVSTEDIGNGINRSKFLFRIKNLGSVTAYSLQLTDDLNNTFPTPITYSVNALQTQTGLTANIAYNGGTIINLLSGTDSLKSAETKTLTLTVSFNMNKSSLTSLKNSGVASGMVPGGYISLDSTQNGSDVDPNNNGISNELGENTPTSFAPVTQTLTNELNIPQGFSPNGDGVNDLFVIRGIDNFPNNQLTIINRWGNVVFKAQDYKNNWDGKSSEGLRFGSDDLPQGTYFYILDLGNNEKPYKGYIYLNREQQ